MTGVRQVSADQAHILAVMADGRLMAWGENIWGQLGTGTTNRGWQNTPVKIMSGVAEACAGHDYSLVRRNDGSLWGCGSNSDGQLDIGNRNTQLRPVRIAAKVGDFVAGDGVSPWITPAGELKVTGRIH